MRSHLLIALFAVTVFASCSKKTSEQAERPEVCQKLSACCAAAIKLDSDFTHVCNRAEAASTELACKSKAQEIRTIIEAKGKAAPAECH